MDRVTIDMLPNVAVLNVFDFYADEAKQIEAWQVCQNGERLFLGHHIA
jgi:hypothetical protein